MKNQPIGTVECPHKGCSEVCNVFKFRKRAEDEKLNRFAGKLYADCPTHGRIGADGKAATQEYLLLNAKMHGPAGGPKPNEAPAPPLKSAEPPEPSKSKKAPAPPPKPAEPPVPKAIPRPWWATLID